VNTKGALVVSIDYEYAWGYADMSLSEADLARIRGEAEITERLLALFDKYEVPATWAVVGRLLEQGSDSAWHDTTGLIKKIAQAKTGHEIGSHSYAHILYSQAGEPAVRADLDAMRRVHAVADLTPVSFVFPRNLEAHHAVLKEHGLKVYRGLRPRWYHVLPGVLRRLGHLADSVLPLYKGVRPSIGKAGLLNLPDSALLFARNGARKFIPARLTQFMFIRGLRAAARRGDIFHLWFHPSNFSYDSDTQFKIFESVLREAARLRALGVLRTLTMRAAAQSMETPMRPALVVDAELKSSLAIIRSLGRRGVWITSGAQRGSAMGFFSRYTRRSFVYRPPLSDPDGFIEDIIAAAKKLPEPPILFSSSDATMLLISRNRDRLGAFIKVLLPSSDSVELASDKRSAARAARELNIPTVPEYSIGTTDSNILADASALRADIKNLNLPYPVVIKPAHTASWAGRGYSGTAAIVTGEDELVQQAMQMRIGSGELPVVQKFVQGGEYGVEVLAKDGEILALAAHKRTRSLSPRGGASTVKVTIEPSLKMIEYTEAFINRVKWSGVAMLEFKEDASTGALYFLEMNGRFWGSLPLAVAAGAGFPLWYYEFAQGQEPAVAVAQAGVTSRHLWGDAQWLVRVLFARDPMRKTLYPSRLRALRDFCKAGYKPDVWSWSDPAPAFAEILDIVARKFL
jgi:predicted ATP-grasp superfamily ATP-dependent carboligase/peptidoglycan/xylan/chitin deacetylase (PgdA/CDA1 family)